MQKTAKQHTLKRFLPGVLVILILLVVVILCVRGCSAQSEEADFDEGISRIRMLESTDPNTVDEAIKERNHQAIIDECDARLAQVDSGEISVWSLFNDYLILGDSRAKDFTMISELDPNRNLGFYGNTALNLSSDYETIAAVNPEYLIVILGMNDVHHNWISSMDDYEEMMESVLQDAKDTFPDTKIFVNPLFPVLPAGLEEHPEWKDLGECDKILREVADRVGVYYVNCDNIPMQDSYYRSDGAHFTVEFMALWAKNMIRTIYASELGLYTSAEEPAELSGEKLESSIQNTRLGSGSAAAGES